MIFLISFNIFFNYSFTYLAYLSPQKLHLNELVVSEPLVKDLLVDPRQVLLQEHIAHESALGVVAILNHRELVNRWIDLLYQAALLLSQHPFIVLGFDELLLQLSVIHAPRIDGFLTLLGVEGPESLHGAAFFHKSPARLPLDHVLLDVLGPDLIHQLIAGANLLERITHPVLLLDLDYV